MKKIIFTIATILTGLVVIYGVSILVKITVPAESTRKQPAPPVVRHTFDDLLDAIEWVESKGDANAIGDGGELGPYQLKKIYVDDVNRIRKMQMTKYDSYLPYNYRHRTNLD